MHCALPERIDAGLGLWAMEVDCGPGSALDSRVGPFAKAFESRLVGSGNARSLVAMV
jgi:hypothetical protein